MIKHEATDLCSGEKMLQTHGHTDGRRPLPYPREWIILKCKCLFFCKQRKDTLENMLYHFSERFALKHPINTTYQHIRSDSKEFPSKYDL